MNIDPTWFLTAISLSGTILNVRKNVLCFYIWLIGDILWCTFDFTQGMYGRSLLDFIQIILAICGIVSWKKDNKALGGMQK
ncbi:MAG: nicotinamide mononucleotide transporter [Clostridia bacterium]|nr:nicotinamide mononucleotide transporter [Clostridia bacterium]